MTRVVAVYVVDYERQAPLKGPDKAIVVAFKKGAFAPVHVVFPGNHFSSLEFRVLSFVSVFASYGCLLSPSLCEAQS